MRPNILFIMTDQQRYDSIGEDCPFRYPNMEQLKNESLSFSNFFTSATPCVPSRACFLMGRNAWDMNICSNSRFMQDDSQTGPLEKSWMQILREEGYICVSVGKTHEVHAGSFHIPVPLGNTFGDYMPAWNFFQLEKSPENEENVFDIYTARRTCDALNRLITTRQNEPNKHHPEPFAMFVGFHSPHPPHILPEKYLSFCRPDNVELPKNRSLDEYNSKSNTYRQRMDFFKKIHGDKFTDDDHIRKGMAAYYCALKMLDDCVGMVMETMKKTGLLDNTIVVFTTDHGELLGDHYQFGKNITTYESEIHIPFFIRFPDKRKAGQTAPQLACSIDFMPTILDLMEIKPDLPLPGFSLVPAINEGREVRDNVLVWHLSSSLTIRTNNAKLVYSPENNDGELYNMTEDPQEMNNLWNKSGYESLKNEMLIRMLQSRLLNDKRSSALTRREQLLFKEIYLSKEPEVGGA